jgi:myxalamid-type nonribosomal peptide synthetase MxaA
MMPYSALRAPNVTGTQEIIRLAATGRITPLHHVSTVSVFPLEAGGGPSRAEFELPADPPPPDIGYSQSKWVAEGVVRTARERGLPITVYRPGHITGDTINGVWRTDDLICRVIRSFVVSGTAPDVDLQSDLHAVDALATSIVRLSRAPGALGRNFHFPTPRPVSIRQFVDVLNAVGYAIRCVPTAEWYERCRARAEDLFSGTEVEMFRRRMEQHAMGIREPVLDAVNAERLLGPEALLPQVDDAMARLYIERLIRIGFLPAPDAAAADLADVIDAPRDRDN